MIEVEIHTRTPNGTMITRTEFNGTEDELRQRLDAMGIQWSPLNMPSINGNAKGYRIVMEMA